MLTHVEQRLTQIVKSTIESLLFRYPPLLTLRYGSTNPRSEPAAPWANAVLKSQKEVDESMEQVRRLGLPLMRDEPKNWDSLAALDLILRTTDTNARIFDAGGERYSVILPWLSLYGYKNLVAENLAFGGVSKRGSVMYRHGDITRTTYPTEYFDAITCLSVIEHGVSLDAYFGEMSRILKTGGVLITSTDYYESKIDTMGQMAFGCPLHVFDKK